jgi:carbonic anhydrase
LIELNRRNLIGGAAGALALAPTAPALAAAPAPAPSKGGKTTLTWRQALELLKQGNRRFVGDRPQNANISRRRRLEIAQSQAPFAVLVSCSDSRVGPEQLFGRGLGELFIVRNAGNTASSNEAMGSIEYGVAVLGAPLVVVLGHERCGAVAAATQVVQQNATFPGRIGRMVEPIIPAALASRGQSGDWTENAIRANVGRTVDYLRTAADPILIDPQRTGQVRVVGAYYDLDTGAVDFFDEG